MQKLSAIRALPAVMLVGVTALTACDAPDERYVPVAPALTQTATASLLVCPAGESHATRGRVLPLVGGLLGLHGTAVSVPAAALVGATEIEIEIPASQHMLIELRANGQEHWQFQAPLTVTIDYSRCGVGLFKPPLTVWHVDPATGELLEPMGGFDNRLARTVTFTTDHFSGYAIAN